LLNPDKDTSLFGTAAMLLKDSFYSWTSSTDMEEALEEEQQQEEEQNEEDERLTDENQSEQENLDDIEINTSCLPRTLILNAYLDMGLQENGKLMADAMAKHTKVEYQLIPGTDHASICWNKNTFVAMRTFMGLDK
jgi:hypothetical protein